MSLKLDKKTPRDYHTAMTNKYYPKGLDGRMRDEDGEIHRKRGDTHMGTIEKEYNKDFGVRDDMRLDTFLKKNDYDSLKEALKDN
jgi:hypothetical protein